MTAHGKMYFAASSVVKKCIVLRCWTLAGIGCSDFAAESRIVPAAGFEIGFATGFGTAIAAVNNTAEDCERTEQ